MTIRVGPGQTVNLGRLGDVVMIHITEITRPRSSEESTLSQLSSYIAKYGPIAGPKLYHALRSRAAYIGANGRRRRAIERLTGRPTPVRKPADRAVARPTPLLAAITQAGLEAADRG